MLSEPHSVRGDGSEGLGGDANGSEKWQMAVTTGYYANLNRSVKLIPWPGGHEVLIAATSDRLRSHSTSIEGRATDSCFARIGAHQCGVQMVDAG